MSKRKGPSRGRNQRPAQALPTPSVKQTPHPQTPYEREQTTKRRGEISELVFALTAARQGFGISRPYGDSERYDIILDPSHLKSVVLNQAVEKSPVIPNQTKKRLVIPNRDEVPVRACPERAEGYLLCASTRPRLIRVQVKATTQLQYGLYCVNAHRRIYGKAVPYTLDEIDFFAAYVIPEDSWFIFPLTHILGATALTLSPKRRRKLHVNNPYREAWRLLQEPDSLEFA